LGRVCIEFIIERDHQEKYVDNTGTSTAHMQYVQLYAVQCRQVSMCILIKSCAYASWLVAISHVFFINSAAGLVDPSILEKPTTLNVVV